ncbi:MAG: CBS domain-containing protein [Planctomycetales bacterium]|nr:CBS domain-containing protein [Planctomycetales bacterium]
MDPRLLALITGLATPLAIFAATGARVLHSFHRHELKEYCRTRSRDQVFDRIMAGHERFGLAAESLQLIASVLALLAGSWLLWGDLSPSEPGAWGRFLGAGVVGAFMLLVCTSWIPWGVVRNWGVPFLFHTYRLWWVASIVAWPLVVGLEFVGGLLQRLSDQPDEPVDEEEALEDEIMSIVEAGEHEGLLEPAARNMIEGIIELDDVTIGEIMTPRSQVDAISIDTQWDEVINFIAETQRSRYPVYSDSLNHVIGVLTVRDLMPHLRDNGPRPALREILRPVNIVPDSKLADEMMQDFLKARQHLAVVVDEYDSVAGIVTIEDVLEEIVGEIRDEAEPSRPPEVHLLTPQLAEVPGHLRLDELEESMPVSFPESDEYDTVGGLLMAMARSVPEVGERFEHAGVRFEVLERASRQVLKVRVDCRDEDEVTQELPSFPRQASQSGADGAGSGDSTAQRETTA